MSFLDAVELRLTGMRNFVSQSWKYLFAAHLATIASSSFSFYALCAWRDDEATWGIQLLMIVMLFVSFLDFFSVSLVLLLRDDDDAAMVGAVAVRLRPRKALGPVETTDEVKERVRVIVNGLKPLERFLEISLKSGETKKVELEYEKLEKHCFSCLSLSHEAGNCPNKTASEDSPSPRLGITQLRTLDRIAESRKRADNRKLSRFSSYERSHGEPTNDSRRDHPRGQPQQRHDY
ncbi:hypothetical protein F2Q68_00036602 [Brassica cretica]|uniref:Zinc knuckle CX2CX4HX4C domain-containing protein n=1 Tax=Brassica cretica TaxID=69181 RepID=A0A8S9GZG1_BRACR|nr:hypothetical protein F2Q68_00036602 [Brassica cretica]